MTEPIHLGVIGLSTRGWASTNLLLAVSTTNPTSAEASAVKYSTAETTVKGYHAPESIAADPNLDLIAVSVNTPNHVENATKAIESGKDLFIEWPAGRGLKETKLLADLAKEKGIRTIVGLQARQSPLFRTVKRLVEAGEIGNVLSTSMTSRISGPYAPWGPTVFKGHEYVLKKDNGATLLDIPEAIFSRHSLNLDGAPTGDVVPADGPSQVAVSGTLKSGAVMSLHWRAGFQTPADVKAATPLVWVIDGTKGSIRIESDNPLGAYVGVYEPTQLWVNGDEVKVEDDGKTNEGRAWEEYLKGEGVGDYADLQHAVQIKSVIDAIWRSAEGGVRVSL
ncbi:uncharacterized protein EV420DRAFT_1649846 [Desarmillaria tabescens]|uniref:NAD(P)-binding protein n=1 Tax=Armillaria tabescens TaxID=1929756 RepID=A0AA39JFW9_ARMTA|nr:uncharacterized protein EV420DRAFT_1649846 [Desarmillaria tabescens]KAK0442041.1 hypothetical protein EV420DRAFT_1649846 [Desarmillaria tabescens]